jgi:glycosyltransferase involved in cell wall biosynthesis
MGKVIICMPEYNEGSVLFDFVDEIKAQLLDVNFVIVDDNSSQEFKDQMINKYNNRQDINLVLNEKNLGHGISTLKALHEALKLDFDIVIGIDGDGQFLATDIMKCLAYLNSDKYLEIVEGV